MKNPLPSLVVIDDDPAVLSTLESLVQSIGCLRWQLFTDPASAEKSLRDPEVGLIICDYRFPGQSGVQFMRDMRKRGVSAPVLFISGTPDTLAVLQSAGISDTYFLGKPFSTGDFSQALSALLG